MLALEHSYDILEFSTNLSSSILIKYILIKKSVVVEIDSTIEMFVRCLKSPPNAACEISLDDV